MDKSSIKVVIVDLSVKTGSPAGSCVLSQMIGLSTLYNIHLFTSEIGSKIPENITTHLIRTLKFPLLFRYIHFSLKVRYRLRRFLRSQDVPCIVQSTAGQYADSDILYLHFCHKAYLKKYWGTNTLSGPLRYLRKLNHIYNARSEAKAIKQVKSIVVPSKGLAQELIGFYPSITKKIEIIGNPVDIDFYRKPDNFEEQTVRRLWGFDAHDIVIVFMALGDFERKGLPILMDSLRAEPILNAPIKVLVIGGNPMEINKYRKRAKAMAIEKKMIFAGFQQDIRSLLWVSDLFSLPSLYETFSLASLQAAAAGLPLLVSDLYGVQDYLRPGENGWLVERDAKAVAMVLADIVDQKYDLIGMGASARSSVLDYDNKVFREKWNAFYGKFVEKDKVPIAGLKEGVEPSGDDPLVN
ncbi:glycosyltransferase family 4 protein [Flavobacteriaceae bacterium TP-CH-4]|uniref:Glycosyltransferase family 4 protein n=1 Tax=Pelagihabitans pacificus TaxID=2696054 RepID=A0A967AWU4_9FLAO|nr:glycosyltransferase family 4 protein [Pelagihabitans pacificus]NHF61387.1 glycosyltransferase family 4 protein [Pelagihabitans pacificus]